MPACTSDNWIAVLQDRAAHCGDHLAYRFLRDGERDEAVLTYAALDRRARAIGAHLATRFAPGSRLLLLYPPGLEFIAALFATWYAGMVAVPCPLPKPVKPGRTRATEDALPLIAADARAEAALTIVRFAPVVQASLGSAGNQPALLTTDDVAQDDGAAAAWAMPAMNAHDLALLQYTSGSTRAPRGVMLTHANLLHNSQTIYDCFGHATGHAGMSWLPHYHDMGLIGGILQPLFVGRECTLMAPAAFVQRPRRWLEAISRYRATTSGGPNSAYELCLRAIPPAERAGLDLSSWNVAFNGAEPVRAQTLQTFAAAFAPCGFRAEAFYPCYGMAEASLLLTGGERGTLPRVHLSREGTSAAPLVSCGRPRGVDELLVVDAATRTACPAGQTGEIWACGRSIGQGYFGDESATDATFRATLAGDSAKRAYLRTGDLGLLDEAGELFVTGRVKDVLVFAGVNHYPQDIEFTMQHAHASLQVDSGAAFAADTGEAAERLFLIQELRRESEKDGAVDAGLIFDAIRRDVAHAHGLRPACIALLPAGALLRTSSGKIRRSACRTAFLSGTLPTVAVWHETDEQPAPSAEAPGGALAPQAVELYQWMAQQLAQVAGINPAEVKPDQPIVRYGLDSPDAIELALTFEQQLGIPLPPTLFWDYQSLGALAEYVWREHRVAAPMTGNLMG